ncbi:MAG: rRNA maturation RNase YbeY [Akkermansia sp.]|nr:rRNA maturation RNase YbeY [Akkermansia sp.]
MIPQVEVYLHVRLPWLDELAAADFEKALNRLLPALLAQPSGPDHVLSELEHVEVSIVDDKTISSVHAEFLHDLTATDVITFPLGNGLGEVVVSAETAERYARKHGIPLREEVFRYMVHGLVHLHGYLDATPALRRELFAVQEPLVDGFLPSPQEVHTDNARH